MKNINIPLEDKDYKKIVKEKGNYLTWAEFLLQAKNGGDRK